jgi:hypothetical protein
MYGAVTNASVQSVALDVPVSVTALSLSAVNTRVTTHVAMPVAYRTGVTARSKLSILCRTGYQGIVLL